LVTNCVALDGVTVEVGKLLLNVLVPVHALLELNNPVPPEITAVST